MSKKDVIRAARVDIPMQTKGEGDAFRLGIALQIVSGPTPQPDSVFILEFTAAAAFQTALQMLLRLPLAQSREWLVSLERELKTARDRAREN
jgi:hypothetical protein